MHVALKKTIREAAPPPFAELQEEGEAEGLACDSGEVRGFWQLLGAVGP